MEVTPCDIKGCRICFGTDCKLYLMKTYTTLEKAYRTVTGLLNINDDNLPPYLCSKCSRCLLNYTRFRSMSLQAHSILLQNVNSHGMMTLELLLSARERLGSIRTECDIRTDSDLDIELAEKENIHESELRPLPVDSVTIKVEPADDYNQDDDNMVCISIPPESINANYIKAEKNMVIKQEFVNVETTSNYDMHEGDSHKIVPVNGIKVEREDVINRDAGDVDSSMVCVAWSEVNTASDDAEGDNSCMIVPDRTDEKSINIDSENKDPFLDEDASSDTSPLGEGTGPTAGGTATEDSELPKDDFHRNQPRADRGYLIHYKLSCHMCPFKTNNEVRWKCHLKAHEAAESFTCDMCNYITTTRNRLLCHYKIHTGVKPYSCDHCERVFNKKHNFDIHYRTHYAVKPFSCHVCKKTFTEKRILEDHERIHSGEKPFSCDVCKKAFAQRSTLRKHMNIHAAVKPYSCDVCHKAFTEKQYVKIHMRVHSGEKPFSCHICNKVFNRKHHLTKHLGRHASNRPYSCDICSKGFVDKSSLRIHTQLHSDEKPYGCDYCSKTFKSKGNAKSHMQRHLKNEYL